MKAIVVTCVLVLVWANAVYSADDIECDNYTVTCEPTGTPLDQILILGPPVYPSAAKITQDFGCWCQNNGAGPPSPTWLTCPQQNFEKLVYLAYSLQYVIGLTNCHCVCPASK